MFGRKDNKILNSPSSHYQKTSRSFYYAKELFTINEDRKIRFLTLSFIFKLYRTTISSEFNTETIYSQKLLIVTICSYIVSCEITNWSPYLCGKIVDICPLNINSTSGRRAEEEKVSLTFYESCVRIFERAMKKYSKRAFRLRFDKTTFCSCSSNSDELV